MNTSRVQKTRALQCAAAGPSHYQHGLAQRTGCVSYGNMMKNYKLYRNYWYQINRYTNCELLIQFPAPLWHSSVHIVSKANANNEH